MGVLSLYLKTSGRFHPNATGSESLEIAVHSRRGNKLPNANVMNLDRALPFSIVEESYG
jgi:hypothetical protein